MLTMTMLTMYVNNELPDVVESVTIYEYDTWETKLTKEKNYINILKIEEHKSEGVTVNRDVLLAKSGLDPG